MTILEYDVLLSSLKGKDIKTELLNVIQNSQMPQHDKEVVTALIEEFGQGEYLRGYDDCELNINDYALYTKEIKMKTYRSTNPSKTVQEYFNSIELPFQEESEKDKPANSVEQILNKKLKDNKHIINNQ